MHIEIDEDKCIASGACVLAAPQHFDQDDDGIVVLLRDLDEGASDVPTEVSEAVRACPAAVLSIRQ